MNITYKNREKLWAAILGACMFNAIFWQEKLGINTVFYDVFVVGSVLILYPEAKSNKAVRWLLLLQSVCLAMVVVQNTLLSKIALMLVLLTFTAFAEYAHRSILFAGGSVILNTALVWETLFGEWKNRRRRPKKKSFTRGIALLFVPTLLAAVFFVLYMSSNQVFSHIANTIGRQIEQLFQTVFSWFSPARLFFLAFGFYVTGWLLLRSARNFFSRQEALYKDTLERFPMGIRFRRKTAGITVYSRPQKPRKDTLALKNENTKGILSLVLLNILLLAVNIIDIVYVWFHFSFSKDVNLSQVVHEGTGLLIFSIVLAMSILLFFFNGNLNFYKKNKWLKYLAYAWIIQNCVLVISVAIRDYYYIAHFGLAYKRIGVLFFLFSVLAGLVTVFIKILYKKTNYYLLRINAWVSMSLLVLATLVHWDQTIAGYNLQHAGTIWVDWEFLLSLSDRTLPQLDRNMHLLDADNQPALPERNRSRYDNLEFKRILLEKERNFLAEQESYSWLSWNYSDNYVKNYLLERRRKALSANQTR